MEQHGRTFTSGRHIPLKFIELDTGCYVCVSHVHKEDGYLAKGVGDKVYGFHRVIWEMHNGPIPEGYEINHLCNNRACQNVKHLECIPVKEHRIITSKNRYINRKKSAEKYWRETRCTGYKLGPMFGVTRQTAYVWIKEWKQNEN